MTEEVDPVLGTDLDTAVDTVHDRHEATDRQSIESALSTVAEDGVVTQSGIDAAFGDTAQAVATPENRLELAGQALATARDIAVPEEVELAASRLRTYETRYQVLEAAVETLRDRLDELRQQKTAPHDVYEVAASMQDLQWDARNRHGDIEALRDAIEDYTDWVQDPTTRVEDLAEDCDYIDTALDGLATTIETLDGGDHDRTPGPVWAEATLQHRVLTPLIDDLAYEVDQLHTWHNADPTTVTEAMVDHLTDIDDRIEDLRDRHDRIGDELDAVASPEWESTYVDDIAAFETTLEDYDPPIQWGRVQAALETHIDTVQTTQQ